MGVTCVFKSAREHFGVLWAFTRDVVDENQGFLIWIE